MTAAVIPAKASLPLNLSGRTPVRWESLESRHAVRKLLSSFAYTGFFAAAKSHRANREAP